MRIAAYARKSVDRDKERACPSTDAQIAAIREWAQANGHTVVDEVDDRAFSGASPNRPGFQRLLAAAKSGSPPFDAVVVTETDRFFRGFRRQQRFIDEFESDCGVQIVALDEIGNSSLERNVKSVINEEEREKGRRRTTRAMRHLAEQGRRMGGRAPYGYSWHREVVDGRKIDSHLIVAEGQAKIVRQILHDLTSGFGYRDIARRLTVRRVAPPGGGKDGWDPTAVRSIVWNAEVYSGSQVYGRRKRTGRNPTRMSDLLPREQWIIHPNAHEAIITSKQLDQIVARREEIASKYAKGGGRLASPGYALSGLMSCADCDGSATIVSGSAKRRTAAYYGCSYRTRRGTCDNVARLGMDEAEDAVLEALGEVVLRPEVIRAVASRYRKLSRQVKRSASHEIRRLEDNRAALQKQLAHYVEAIGDGRPRKSILAKVDAIELEIEQLDAHIEESRRPREPLSLPDEAQLRARVADARRLLGGAKRRPQQLRQVLKHEFDAIRLCSDRSMILEPSSNGLFGQLLGLEPRERRFRTTVGVPNGI